MSFEIRRLKEERSRKSTILHSLLPVLHHILQWILVRQRQRADKERRHRIITIVIASVCAAVLLAVAWNLLQTLRAFSLQTILSAGSTTLAEDAYGQTNMLLLGNGDSTHDGVDLIDSIIIASLDRKTESIALLSLPRDLYFLHTEKMGSGRLNSLYRDYKYSLERQGKNKQEASLEALRQLATEISTVLSLEIHHVIKIDFTGFTAAIDAIGGIPIDIPDDLTDTAFPGPNYQTETFAIQKGHHILNGMTALQYARSRSTTSDFDRSARQQLLLEALGKHARETGLLTKPNKLLTLFKIVRKNLETTLSIRELLTLAKIGRGFRSPQILQMHLSDRNGLYGEILEPGGFLYAPPRDQFDGASVLLPISHPEFPVTWKQPKTLMNIFFHQRPLHLAHPQISLLNAGAPPGSARLLADELLRYGFSIETIGNAPFQKQETSFVLDSGQQELEASFGSLLRLPVHAAPLPASPRTTTSLSIVLGKDYRFVHLQDLPPSAL